MASLFVTVTIGCQSEGASSATPADSTVASSAPSGPSELPRSGLALRVHSDGFDQPVAAVAYPDAGGLLVVAEQGGTTWLVDGSGVVRAPFLDLTDRVSVGDEAGLLAIAFSPDFARDRRLYVMYTDAAASNVLAEYTVVEGRTPDLSSERIILTIPKPSNYHNGGGIAFGPDGYLYVGIGDGFHNPDRPELFGTGQDVAQLLGVIIRIDPDATRDRPYQIPPDNPFVDSAPRDEIWAYGLRNPWRMSFDTNGDLYVADVGTGNFEELNIQPATSGGGLNYGWSVMEGAHCFSDPACDVGAYEPPAAVYTHEIGCAIVGGHVYRGTTLPELAGLYLAADFCTGRIWTLNPLLPTEGFVERMDAEFQISSLGQTAAGEILVLDYPNGVVYEVVPSDPPVTPPAG